MNDKLKLYWELARPKTLLPPILGMLCIAIVAFGATPRFESDWATRGWTFGHLFHSSGIDIVFHILIGMVMAAVLNAASNVVNQVADIENDKINKPHRPIPSGRLPVEKAAAAGVYLWIVALFLAFLINWQCFIIVVIASFFIYGYSMPPMRFKAKGLLANFTIAIPRGLLLPVAGWSTVKSVDSVEPWYLGSIFFLFILGACTTKDFSDMEGDAAAGCPTLPVMVGVKRSVTFISPFFVLPFFLIPLGVTQKILTGNAFLLWALTAALVLYGLLTVSVLHRDPKALAKDENHPSWRHMYAMMMLFQIGLAVSYLL